jgi:hypothetical protein
MWKIVIVLLFCANFCFAQEASISDLLKAIRIVETGGTPDGGENAKGDNGKAIGPFQIHWAYWKDATDFDRSIGGKYEDCNKYEYSVKVVRAYFRRYGSKFLQKRNLQALARIHNGGPKGHKKPSTLPYWKKVKDQLGKK